MQIPYFNAPIFLENKTQIGKVEEILGPINNVVSILAFNRKAASREGVGVLIHVHTCVDWTKLPTHLQAPAMRLVRTKKVLVLGQAVGVTVPRGLNPASHSLRSHRYYSNLPLALRIMKYLSWLALSNLPGVVVSLALCSSSQLRWRRA